MANKEKKLKAIEQMKEEWGVCDSDLKSKRNKKEVAAWLQSRNSYLMQWYIGKCDSVNPVFFFTNATKKEMLNVLSSQIVDPLEGVFTVWDPKGKERLVKITGIKLV